MIQNAFLNIVPLHPSLDFLWLHWITSNHKMKRLFVNFNQLSGLSLSDDCFHLLRLDISVQIPLAYTRSVLPYPFGITVSMRSIKSLALTPHPGAAYSATNPRSLSIVTLTSLSGSFCVIWSSMIRALYGSQSTARNVGAFLFRVLVGGPIDGAGTS